MNRPLIFPVSTSSSQIQGLNHLRLLAALLVFLQHSLSSSHLDEWIDIGGFRIGRIGTAIFFLLSGYLSAVTTRKPATWLKDRLVFLFPAYWIVTLAGFFLAWVTATKSFDSWQFLSQMLGTGYLTHGDHIVNVATWFMSPLLLLYCTVTLVRLTNARYTLPLIILGMCAAAVAKEAEFAATRCHAVTFLTAFAVGVVEPRRRVMGAMVMAGLFVILSFIQPEFRYGATAAILLIPAFYIRTELSLSRSFTKIAYEWFLVHGLCLAIVNHLTSNAWVILAGGGLLAIAAAAFLHAVVLRLRSVTPAVMSHLWRMMNNWPVKSRRSALHAEIQQGIGNNSPDATSRCAVESVVR
ncbi:MAG: acyltransferase [Planctomyces sp.]|nr:acyltransferase [Planctomyces sp.]